MSSIRMRSTARQFALANLVVGVVLVGMIRLCNGADLYEFDAGKMALTVAVVFGMPAVLARLRWRVAGADRPEALRAGIGLHAVLMAALCTLPLVLWAHELFVPRGPMRTIYDCRLFYRSFAPSPALAALSRMAGVFLLARRRRSPLREPGGINGRTARGPRPPSAPVPGAR